MFINDRLRVSHAPYLGASLNFKRHQTNYAYNLYCSLSYQGWIVTSIFQLPQSTFIKSYETVQYTMWYPQHLLNVFLEKGYTEFRGGQLFGESSLSSLSSNSGIFGVTHAFVRSRTNCSLESRSLVNMLPRYIILITNIDI